VGWSGRAHGVDASVGSSFRPFFGGFSFADRARRKLYRPDRVPYRRGHLRYPHLHEAGEPSYPIVLSNFDNTPRSGRLGVVLLDATPARFEEQLRYAVELAHRPQVPEPVVFLRSWNEWAEGNYVEPDRRQGRALLEVIRRVQSDAVSPAPGR
jgi:hypothetical protein